MKILVTGATGFIGRRLVTELLTGGHELYLLTRPQSRNACLDIFGHDPRITFIEGDIEDTDVVLSTGVVSAHMDQIESVVHLAALYDLTAGLAPSYMRNVIGTQNVLGLLRRMKKVKTFHYFSTYAVNPLERGISTEELLVKDEVEFPDDYTRTKNEAEHIVRNHTPEGITAVIHRPGVIIGDSNDGRLDKINGPYYFYEFIRHLKLVGPLTARIPLIPMPLRKGSLLPVLPVDILVKWSAHIISNPPTSGVHCYHLLSDELIDTKEFLERSMELIGLPLKLLPFRWTKVFPPFFPLLRMPTEIIFYMKQATVFDRSALNRDYPELKAPRYEDYLPAIIKGYLEARV